MQLLRSFPSRETSSIADKDMTLTESESAPALEKHRNFLEIEYTCTFLAASTSTILYSTVQLVTSFLEDSLRSFKGFWIENNAEIGRKREDLSLGKGEMTFPRS